MIKKRVNKYIKFFDKNILRIIFITVIFFVFLQEFNFFSNTYYLINKGHDTRATDSYKKTFFSGYCKGSSHGYLFSIKNKYSGRFRENEIPKIINNFNGKEEYWIFQDVNARISEKQIIILNKKNDIDQKKYQIIDQSGLCFFIEEKND
tara:strand:+ start:34 stop:480 length:447 start_codon:yes stop_codon:yes gene_type:complete